MIIRIAYNHDTGTKLENSYLCIKKFSSISARKLKCPSSARLSSGNFSSNSSLESNPSFPISVFPVSVKHVYNQDKDSIGNSYGSINSHKRQSVT